MLLKPGAVPGRLLFGQHEHDAPGIRTLLLSTEGTQLFRQGAAPGRGVYGGRAATCALREKLPNFRRDPSCSLSCRNCRLLSGLGVSRSKLQPGNHCRVVSSACSSCRVSVSAHDETPAERVRKRCHFFATRLLSPASAYSGGGLSCRVQSAEVLKVASETGFPKPRGEKTAKLHSCNSSPWEGCAYGTQDRGLSTDFARRKCSLLLEHLPYRAPSKFFRDAVLSAKRSRCRRSSRAVTTLRFSSRRLASQTRLNSVESPTPEEAVSEILLLSESEFDSRMGGLGRTWQWFDWLSSQQGKLRARSRPDSECTQGPGKGLEHEYGSFKRPATQILEETDLSPSCSPVPVLKQRMLGNNIECGSFDGVLGRTNTQSWQQDDVVTCAEQIGQHVLALSPFRHLGSTCCRPEKRQNGSASTTTSSLSVGRSAEACSPEQLEVCSDDCQLGKFSLSNQSDGSTTDDKTVDSLELVSPFSSLLTCSLGEGGQKEVVFELKQVQRSPSHHDVSARRGLHDSAHPSPSRGIHTEDEFHALTSRQTTGDTEVGSLDDDLSTGDYSRLLLPICYQKPRYSPTEINGREEDAVCSWIESNSSNRTLPPNAPREDNSEFSPLTVFCYPVFSSRESVRQLLSPLLGSDRRKTNRTQSKGPSQQRPDNSHVPDETSSEVISASSSPFPVRSYAPDSAAFPSSSSSSLLGSFPRSSSTDLLSPILSRLPCLSSIDSLSLLFAFAAIPATLSGSRATATFFNFSSVKERRSLNKNRVNEPRFHEGSENPSLGKTDSEMSLQVVLQRLIRQVLPGLQYMPPSFHLDVMSTCIRLSRLADSFGSSQWARRRSGSPSYTRRSEQKASLSNTIETSEEIFLLASAFLDKVAELTTPSQQLDHFRESGPRAAAHHFCGAQTEAPTRDIDVSPSSHVVEEEVDGGDWRDRGTGGSASTTEVPLSLKAVVNFVCIANAGRERRLPEHLTEIVTFLTDYCCERLHQLSPVDLTNLICALSPKKGQAAAAASDEFCLFLMAKFVQQRPHRFKPAWLTLIVDAYTRAGLEDWTLYDALTTQVKHQFADYSLQDIVTVLAGLQRVRFRDEEFLHLAYSALEEGARKQLLPPCGEVPYSSNNSEARGFESDALPGETQPEGDSLKKERLGEVVRVSVDETVAIKAGMSPGFLPLTRPAVESCIASAGLLDATSLRLKYLWRLYLSQLQAELGARDRGLLSTPKQQALVHEVCAMLPQVVLQEPEVTPELIDAWLQICSPVASGVLGRKLVAPAMRHRLLCEAHELQLLPVMPNSEMRRLHLTHLDEMLQTQCASRRLENTWAPESSTFHVDVASALLSLNVRYEAEVRVAGLFVLDLIVTLPNEYEGEDFHRNDGGFAEEVAPQHSPYNSDNKKQDGGGSIVGSKAKETVDLMELGGRYEGSVTRPAASGDHIAGPKTEGISYGSYERPNAPVYALERTNWDGRKVEREKVDNTNDVVLEIPPLHTCPSIDGNTRPIEQKPWGTQEVKKKELPFEISVRW